EVEGDEEVEKKKDRSSGRVQQQYPLKPDVEDYAFYLKTGTCEFGFNCKFNHPLGRRKNQLNNHWLALHLHTLLQSINGISVKS
ncbi:hypothetical protein HN51_039017, partial [Arachis hypogaea]